MGNCIYRPRLPDRSGMGDVATLRCSATADTVDGDEAIVRRGIDPRAQSRALVSSWTV